MDEADETDQLKREIERLRKALTEITWDGPIWRAQRIAREALGIPALVNQQTAPVSPKPTVSRSPEG